MPWRDVLAAVFDEGRDETHFFAHERGGKGGKHPVDRKTCVTALRLAARQRGVTTLRPHEYAEQREKVISQVRGSNRQERKLRWPVATQIISLGWNQVISEAGLEVPEPFKARNLALPYTEALAIFLEHFGYLPAENPLRRTFVDRGLHLTVSGLNHTDAIAELRRQRADTGLWTPHRRLIGKRDTFPEVPETVEAAFEVKMAELREHYASTPKGHWTLELVERAFDRAVDRVPPGRSLTYRRYNEIARGDPGMPYASAIQRVCATNGTSFKELREAALQRRASSE